MHFDPRHNRHGIRISAEARLCHIGGLPGAPSPSGAESGSEWLAGGLLDWANRWLIQPPRSIATGTWRALREAFGDRPDRIAGGLAALRNSVDFLQSAPLQVRRIVEDKIARMNLNREQITGLLSHGEWLSTLRSNGLNFDEEASGSAAAAATPLAILKSMSPQDRKNFLIAYVDHFFPGDASTLIPELGRASAPASRFADAFSDRNRRNNVIDAMRGMVGIHDLPADSAAYSMARVALQRRYFERVGGTWQRRANVLHDDYTHVLEQNPGRSRADDLREAASTGYLRGALRLGVVQDEHLSDLRDLVSGVIAQDESRRNAVRARTSTELTGYLGVLNAEAQERMRNADRIPTWLWWLAGILGFANKGTRTPTMFVAGIMGLMYLRGNNRPHRDVAQFLGSVTGLGADTFNSVTSGILPSGLAPQNARISQQDINRYSDAVTRFLSRNARANLDASTGIAALSFMPLRHIMTAYTPPRGGSAGTFRPQENTDFQREARAALPDRRGIRRSGIISAFEDGTLDGTTGRSIGQRNTEEVRVALENICFILLKEKGNDSQMRRAELVESAMMELPEGRRVYQDLLDEEREHPTMGRYNPRQLFRELVAEGYVIAQNDNETLGDFILRHVGLPTSQQQSEQQAAEKREKDDMVRAEALKARLASLPPAPGYTFGVVLTGGASSTATVTLTGAPGSLAVPISIRDFASRTPDNFATFWIERAAAQRKLELENTANFPATYTLGTFTIQRFGADKIRYGVNPLTSGATLRNTTAEDDVYLFLTTPRNDIYAKYQGWHTSLPVGVAPPNRSALTS